MRLLLLLSLLACRDDGPRFHCKKTLERACQVDRCPFGDCFVRERAWCRRDGFGYACHPTREECGDGCREMGADELPK